jgi:hypothetical protein
MTFLGGGTYFAKAPDDVAKQFVAAAPLLRV